jgi:hypothetical protein
MQNVSDLVAGAVTVAQQEETIIRKPTRHSVVFGPAIEALTL